MGVETVIDFAKAPLTWALYFVGIVAFLFLHIKQKYSKETFRDFFKFYFGIGAFLFGLGAGFQALSDAINVQIHLSYTIHSLITLIFIIIYIFLIWKLAIRLFNTNEWAWLGTFIILFFLGCCINAILTGGRYLPFVGWLYGS